MPAELQNVVLPASTLLAILGAWWRNGQRAGRIEQKLDDQAQCLTRTATRVEKIEAKFDDHLESESNFKGEIQRSLGRIEGKIGNGRA